VPIDLAEAYRIARAEKKAAEERVDLLDNQIRDLLAGRRRAVCGGRLVASRSVFETRRLDTTRLRKEQPEVAEAYTTVTTVDKLTPGRAKS
jgi:hypothetical protein